MEHGRCWQIALLLTATDLVVNLLYVNKYLYYYKFMCKCQLWNWSMSIWTSKYLSASSSVLQDLQTLQYTIIILPIVLSTSSIPEAYLGLNTAHFESIICTAMYIYVCGWNGTMTETKPESETSGIWLILKILMLTKKITMQCFPLRWKRNEFNCCRS